ncbi:DUF4907 domain-containing protein [Dysgonamonadaceae bacterium]|nr:DUF4907 domain-containing protein [Dysgonamonadaceae bacterium]
MMICGNLNREMNTMNMIKKLSILLFSVIAIILLIYSSPSGFLSNKNKNADIYRVKTFKSGDGWGYRISKNNKIIILQPHIPCIKGDRPFPNEKSALEIGELVLSKIRNNEDLSITIDELNEKIDIGLVSGDH